MEVKVLWQDMVTSPKDATGLAGLLHLLDRIWINSNAGGAVINTGDGLKFV
jgi:threonine synthase